MSFLVCRTLFKQSKAASMLQTYIVATSTYGALKAASLVVPDRETLDKDKHIMASLDFEANVPRRTHSKNGASLHHTKPKVPK